MTQKELEIAQAACCVGTIWDQYEGTEEFDEMVGKRVQHLIKLVRNYLGMGQPEADLEKEIQEHIKECLDIKFPTTDIELIKKDVVYTARKFYELGLNAKKEK